MREDAGTGGKTKTKTNSTGERRQPQKQAPPVYTERNGPGILVRNERGIIS